MSVDAANPGRGDVAGIIAASRERSRKAGTVRDAAAVVDTSVVEASGSGWVGLAREAFVDAAETLAADLRVTADRLDAEAAAYAAYGRGVQEVQDAQRVLELRRAELTADLASVRRRISSAEREAEAAEMFTALPDTAHDRARALTMEASGLAASLSVAGREWDGLVERRRQVNAAAVAALSGAGVLGPLALLRGGGAAEAGRVLTDLSAADLLTLMSTDPGFAERLRSIEPAGVAAWWAGLGDSERDALITAMPALIGNLEGVSYTSRDKANRIWLTQQLAETRKQIDGLRLGVGGLGASGGYQQEAAVVSALGRLRGLEAIELTLTQATEGAPRFLISLTSDRPPLAAVSIGNLDTADNVTYAVPGMGSSAETLPDWAGSAQEVLRAQIFADTSREQAVVAWVGYKAPPVGGTEVLGTQYARAGAVNLGVALAGFAATRPDADLNVIAHSYGTTTASIALTVEGVHVDTFVSIGSAGLTPSIDHASDLHADDVYAGQAQDVWAIDPAPGDQWAWVGRAFGDHPVNPTGSSFGAQVFGVDTGVGGSSVTDHGVSTDDGTGYLNIGTESLRNVAFATTGGGDKLTSPVVHEPTPFQKAIIGASGVY